MELNKDYKGRRFGKLLVENVIEKRSKSNKIKYFFLCRCECGRTRRAIPADVKNGKIFQCGYCGQEKQQSEAKEFSENLKKSRMIERLSKIMQIDIAECERVYKKHYVLKPIYRNKALSSDNYFYGDKTDYDKLLANRKTESKLNVSCYRQKIFDEMVEKYSNHIGIRYGRNVIIEIVKHLGRAVFKYRCDCGNVGLCNIQQMRDGHKKSCGCIIQEMIDNKRSEIENALLSVYYGMITRCYNKNSDSYKYYGEENKKICDNWLNDKETFIKWGIDNGYVIEKLSNGINKWTIERIDNNGDYSPENCRWATQKEQAQNQRPRQKRGKYKRKTF